MRHQIDEELMHEVEKKFPGTKWADLAAFNRIDNKLCGEWQGDPKCPEKETEAYEKYVNDHANSPKAAEALYEAAWRQGASDPAVEQVWAELIRLLEQRGVRLPHGSR